VRTVKIQIRDPAREMVIPGKEVKSGRGGKEKGRQKLEQSKEER